MSRSALGVSRLAPGYNDPDIEGIQIREQDPYTILQRIVCRLLRRRSRWRAAGVQ